MEINHAIEKLNEISGRLAKEINLGNRKFISNELLALIEECKCRYGFIRIDEDFLMGYISDNPGLVKLRSEILERRKARLTAANQKLYEEATDLRRAEKELFKQLSFAVLSTSAHYFRLGNSIVINIYVSSEP